MLRRSPIISGGSGGGGGALALLGSSVLAADTATLNVPSIPAGANALQLIAYGRTDAAGAADNCKLTFNGDTGGNYNWFTLSGGNSAATGANSGGAAAFILVQFSGNGAVAGAFSGMQFVIPQYSATVGQKSVAQYSSAQGNFRGDCGLWLSTAAINRVTITPGSGTVFRAGSALYVYGVT